MKTYAFLLLMLLAAACTKKESFDASTLGVEWELVKNNYDGKGNFLAALNFRSNQEIPSKGWKIFFSLRYHTKNLDSQTKGFLIEHVNGELFTISPTPEFTPRKSFTIQFSGGRRIANFQDVPSGFFMVLDDQDKAIEIARTFKTPEIDFPEANVYSVVEEVKDPIKVIPTPVKYVAGKGTFTIDKSTTVSYDFESEGNYLINEIEKISGFKISNSPSGNIQIKKASGTPESYSLSITDQSITINAADAAGAFYAIQSLKQLFPIESWSAKNQTIGIEAVEIRDQPRFPIREFMIDVGRNFESKANILRLLEVMSLYKMNTFHFHFNDDEGWRLEIPGLPELTDIGAARGYPYESNERLQPSYGSGPTESNHHGTGYYSRADFVEILKYATERHIQVIPEIESPGHARAAIKAMEARYNRLMKEGKKDEAERFVLHDINDQSKYTSAQLFKDNAMNVASPSVFAFMEKVIMEFKDMYKEANAPFTVIHMGGDEVAKGAWESSPAIEEYKKNNPSIKTPKDIYADFFVKTTSLLGNHGLKITGWEEMIIEDPHIEATTRKVIDHQKYKDANLTFDAWWDIQGKQDMCYPIANAGYGVVLTPFDYYYFDLAQSPGFDEPGDAWIGYLWLEKSFSFTPFDIYSSNPFDMQMNTIEAGRFKDKEKLTAQGQKNVRGLQAALWAENMTYDGYMEYQVLPRLLAIAERAWAPERNWENKTGDKRKKDFTADWSSFATRVGTRDLPRLDYYNGGYAYRLPTPSFKVENGKVSVTAELPGIIIRYTTDGSEPLASSEVYSGPVTSGDAVRFRAFSSSGRGGATVMVH